MSEDRFVAGIDLSHREGSITVTIVKLPPKNQWERFKRWFIYDVWYRGRGKATQEEK